MDFLALFDGFFSSLTTVKNSQEITDGERNSSASVDTTKKDIHQIINARVTSLKETRQSQAEKKQVHEHKQTLKR